MYFPESGNRLSQLLSQTFGQLWERLKTRSAGSLHGFNILCGRLNKGHAGLLHLGTILVVHVQALLGPNIKIIPFSARNGDGVEEWANWLREQINAWIK